MKKKTIKHPAKINTATRHKKTKKIVAASGQESAVHNTSADEMPDPNLRRRGPPRKEVRYAFR